MNSLSVYLGFFYVVIGTFFLVIPLIYLELGRPKDLIKAFLNFLIGLILIIKNKTIDESFFVILFLTVLVLFYVVELFLIRWNQLTDKEKNNLTTFLEFKKNVSKILEAFNLGVSNFKKPLNFIGIDKNNQNVSQKKWVRNDKNDNIKNWNQINWLFETCQKNYWSMNKEYNKFDFIPQFYWSPIF